MIILTAYDSLYKVKKLLFLTESFFFFSSNFDLFSYIFPYFKIGVTMVESSLIKEK